MSNPTNTDINILREFKDKFELTWPLVAEALGMSLSGVEHWRANKSVPKPYKILMKIFLTYPKIFTEFHGKKF